MWKSTRELGRVDGVGRLKFNFRTVPNMPRFQCGSARSAAQMLASDREPRAFARQPLASHNATAFVVILSMEKEQHLSTS